MNRTGAILGLSALGLTAIFLANRDEIDSSGYKIYDSFTMDGRAMPACVARDGTPVKYVVADTNALAAFSYKLKPGVKLDEINVPQEPGAYIVFPQVFHDQMTPLMLAFASAHECAHHKLGHTEDKDYRYNDTPWLRKIEADADCEAAHIMRRDYRISQPEVAHATQAMFQFIANKYGEKFDIHDPPSARYNHTMACLKQT